MKIDSTGWEIVGASGITVKLETPGLNIEVGASYIRLPIRHIESNTSTLLQGPGVGGGFGASIAIPGVSISGSLDQFPADGIGSIIKVNPHKKENFVEDDFYGNMMVFSLSAGKEVSGELSGVLWFKKPVEACLIDLKCSRKQLKDIAVNVFKLLIGSRVPGGTALVLAQRLYSLTKAAGSFAGMNIESQLLGAGVDVFHYRVSV